MAKKRLTKRGQLAARRRQASQRQKQQARRQRARRRQELAEWRENWGAELSFWQLVSYLREKQNARISIHLYAAKDCTPETVREVGIGEVEIWANRDRYGPRYSTTSLFSTQEPAMQQALRFAIRRSRLYPPPPTVEQLAQGRQAQARSLLRAKRATADRDETNWSRRQLLPRSETGESFVQEIQLGR